MKLISYRHGGKDSYGVVKGDGIVDIGKRAGARLGTVKAVLAQGALAEVAKLAEGAEPEIKLAEIEYRLPITDPAHIFCVGRNYRAYHEVQEMANLPKWPSIFPRFISSFVAHNQPIIRPTASEQLDFEGELAVVIGKRGRHVAKERALDYIAGYTCLNEGSVRDWQSKGTQNFPGKNFHHSGSIGPWMVTADEIGDPMKLHIKTRLNGQVMQDGGAELMIFDIAYVISHVSEITFLEPGDIITTGSPGGSGVERKPPVWMKPGDVLELEIATVGTLRNSVVAE